MYVAGRARPGGAAARPVAGRAPGTGAGRHANPARGERAPHYDWPMRAAAIACACTAALVVAAGCGSSGGSGSSATASGAGATAARTPTSSLKVIGKPKYGKPSSSAPVRSGTVAIAYRNVAIQPDTVRVRVGTKIVWTNYDAIEHNVTSEGGPQSFASKTFGEGGSFQIVAGKPGLIHYQCTIHPASMNGTIEVVR